ncbi:MAG: AfsR/SARP family transcriptional regulator, partial [Propionibacteriales bacterium]|nr:AfsR/SARP family transcriptional regulator [Propionibacteriales bacterium]
MNVLPPADLPVRLTRFFGRRTETTELAWMVDRVTLLTLVGAPGCGKTRLGVELGALVEPRFRDSVRFVALGSLADPALVASAVAVACGVQERPGERIEDTLVEALTGAELLLVLDNCEHVVDAAADLARRLVVTCPRAHVLATSRVALGLPGEQVCQVPPLEIASAIELFTDRASLASHDFPVDGT